MFSDTFHAMFKVLVWHPVADLPGTPDKWGVSKDDHQQLEGRPVADTARRAFLLVRAMRA